MELVKLFDFGQVLSDHGDHIFDCGRRTNQTGLWLLCGGSTSAEMTFR